MKIYVEERDVRAVKGGMGMAKTGGNYAASLRAGDLAEKAGYSQVLWLDGVHRKGRCPFHGAPSPAPPPPAW
mgnify:CR=1 FL=1